jgi:serine/threonine-protein kinase HipA
MTSRVLNVWWGSRVVGQFTQDRHGDIAFRMQTNGLSIRRRRLFPPLCRSDRNNSLAANAAHFLGGFSLKRASAWFRHRLWAFRQGATSPFSIV